MQRSLFTEEHDLFRDTVRGFVADRVVPSHDDWDDAGIVPRELFTGAGALGMLALQAPERFGGGGMADFRFNQVLLEEFHYAGVAPAGLSLSLHNDIVLPYFTEQASEDQQARWLPGICTGETITAVAMTEPGTGSDLASVATTARRDGDHYVVNGSKTFISNGINADLVVTAVKTDPSKRHAGMSLVVVERGMEGFERGRNLDKIGMHAQDTAELHFSDVRVPIENRLGEEGEGFTILTANLPQERLAIAISGVAAARAAVDWALAYVKERTAFGRPIGDFQHTKFVLAECDTEVTMAEVFTDTCVLALNAGSLSAADASRAKWWCTELQKRTIDRCLQLFGGYGYMREYPIARAYADARITTIYGGTTEIMKTIIAKDLGL
ncbi:acyl-CoA dehydrogenase family protein [Euzebya sp.]|uniref:acyl-CoA dehydrogenase family protein n=1 Tax=Euzebya sp. TaxID=1971409 RepID=UPI00351542C5